jgi:hypothetical protein
MTISSTVRIAGPFIGTSTATVFPFAFKVFTASNLQVVRVDTSTGLESTLVLTTDYTVSLNTDQDSNPGGNVTLSAFLATGFTMVITSDIANLQPTDLTNQGGFYPEVITDALDRATIQIQQMADELVRSIKTPISDGLALDMELPNVTNRASKYLVFDGSGLPSVSSGTGTDTSLRTDLSNTSVALAGASLVGFRASNANSTARTVLAKLRDTISVKDFGAVGDGVTDDTDEFNAAITAAGTKNIYVPGGSYKITGTVTGSFYSDGIVTIVTGTVNSINRIGSVLSTTGAATIQGAATIEGINIGKGGSGVASNIAIGVSTLTANTTGSENTVVGHNALIANTTGGSNTAIGSRTLNDNTTGIANNAIGYNALSSNTSGLGNIAVGNTALQNNTTGNYNTAIGSAALSVNTTGSNSTAVGNDALKVNTTGTENTAVGYNSLRANTTGDSNTAAGYLALNVNTTGDFNTAVGASALSLNTSGIYNTAVGRNSLRANTIGNSNTAVGLSSLNSNTDGEGNTGVGWAALDTNTTGDYNTAIGYQSLMANTSGTYNTAIGFAALNDNTTGVGNTAVGQNAGNTLTTGSNVTCLGNNSLPVAATSTNQVILGDTAITALRCQVALTVVSDGRDKQNVTDIPVGMNFINELRPVSFTWNQRDGKRIGINEFGFIAQDVQAAQNRIGTIVPQLINDENPDNLSMCPTMLIPVLVNAIKELNSKFELYVSTHP